MKRLIRNILEKEGYVKDGILYYKEEKDGIIFSRLKDVSMSCISIETAIDTTPLKPQKCIGITYCITKEEIDCTNGTIITEKKKWAFEAVLTRLLADGLHPKGLVHIWTEGRDGFLYVYGKCLYE